MMGGFFGCGCSGTSGGGGGSSPARLGARLMYVSPGGTIAGHPPGFSAATGRLVVDTTAGDTQLTSLTATGVDGQLLTIENQGPNALQLNAGAGFLNDFDTGILPKSTVDTYFDSVFGGYVVIS